MPEPQISSMKVLMLHGYTQNGELFHVKTRVLQKHLQKIFPGITFTFPTGPLRLNLTDVPGYDSAAQADGTEIEAYGWWRRSDATEHPDYVGMDDSLSLISKLLAFEGPFDGVIGFSQGAAFAAIISSLLEGPSRQEGFKKAQSRSSLAIPYPSSFKTLQHPPMKFCVSYSGFIAPGERYIGFYDPQIRTPVCHFIGSLDSVVVETRTSKLVEACGGEAQTLVVTHPGGHFVPTGKQFLDILAGFVKNTTTSGVSTKNREEEKVEDMEMPF